MKRRRDERGFAMLLVFLMAALIGIALYMEIPRVSFESQRAKEQLLIERGEQYKRAIQVFVRANKKYPGSIKELESFNNHRYLRKQYVDPMTGKKEWRLVHIGAGGVFTDSLVYKPKDDKDKDKKGDGTSTGTTPTTTIPGTFDPNNPTGQPQPASGPPRRASEMPGHAGGLPGQPGYGAPPQIDPATGQPIAQPSVPGQPGMPGTVYPTGMPGQPYPVQPGQTVPGQPYTGQPYTGQPYTGQPYTGQPYTGQPGQVVPGQPYPVQPGQVMPGQPYPVQPGQVVPGQPYPVQGGVPGQPGQPTYPYSTQPGAQGTAGTPFTQPGMMPATPGGPTPPNDAQRMIQDLLTRPRTTPAANPTAAPGGQQIGGGIAGVASTAEAEGIKIYYEKTNYKEWEFIYDYTKDKGPAGATGATPPGTPVQQMGTAPGQQPAQPGTSPMQPMQPGQPMMPGTAPSFSPPMQQPPRQ